MATPARTVPTGNDASLPSDMIAAAIPAHTANTAPRVPRTAPEPHETERRHRPQSANRVHTFNNDVNEDRGRMRCNEQPQPYCLFSNDPATRRSFRSLPSLHPSPLELAVTAVCHACVRNILRNKTFTHACHHIQKKVTNNN